MRGIDIQSQPRLKQSEPRPKPNMRARASVATESPQNSEQPRRRPKPGAQAAETTTVCVVEYVRTRWENAARAVAEAGDAAVDLVIVHALRADQLHDPVAVAFEFEDVGIQPHPQIVAAQGVSEARRSA